MDVPKQLVHPVRPCTSEGPLSKGFIRRCWVASGRWVMHPDPVSTTEYRALCKRKPLGVEFGSSVRLDGKRDLYVRWTGWDPPQRGIVR